jgi:hypothetical protein
MRKGATGSTGALGVLQLVMESLLEAGVGSQGERHQFGGIRRVLYSFSYLLGIKFFTGVMHGIEFFCPLFILGFSRLP